MEIPQQGLNTNASDDLVGLRALVADSRKQAQLLLERFQRGEISQTDAQAEARRIEAEVVKSERTVHELELRGKSGGRSGFTV